MTFFEEDRASGRISAPTRLAVIDGIPGWLVVTDLPLGTTWAYAPQWYALLWGEIAREV